jgi:hypothetical protein
MRFETFVNWLNDFHWGPFESMHPPKDVDMDRQLFVRICIWGCLLMVLMIVLLLMLLNGGLFYSYYHRIPSAVDLGRMMGRIVRFLWWLPAIGVVLFPLLWWPCTVCWNRRAARLRRQAADGPATEVLTNIWPPPPVRE